MQFMVEADGHPPKVCTSVQQVTWHVKQLLEADPPAAAINIVHVEAEPRQVAAFLLGRAIETHRIAGGAVALYSDMTEFSAAKSKTTHEPPF